ncbi:unnamed protein product [Didymodactylos carnosus]|uniref:Peptide hydrolase n=1 Tax=Didymodactylos carnosus TaxID=1234261 RepID=A0A8S2DSW0_9BILA|nr:unnamed protein product [Didymodactylos carnosus]CAF3763543.1 unnamed protein product [Didymodactylos carnosus]
MERFVLRDTKRKLLNSYIDSPLARSVQIDQMLNHLQEFQNIADASGGTRATGTQGFNATLDYITTYLTQNTNFKVDKRFLKVNAFRVLGSPKLILFINNAQTNFIYGFHFYAMTHSSSANFSSPVRLIKVPNFGCSDADWLAVSSPPANGSVALVQRGNCTFEEKSLLATKYNVAGLLLYNGGTPPDRLEPFQAAVSENSIYPALTLSYQAGMTLVKATSNPSANASVLINFDVQYQSLIGVNNICADTPGGNPKTTIIIGSHSDSVQEGPGINDNGSGSAANLVLAVNLARLFRTSEYKEYPNRVRFCWWAAEEGKEVGSKDYVKKAKNSTIIGERLQDVLVNLNFDMLGSPNYKFGIYDYRTTTYTTGASALPGSKRLSELFRDWFINQELPWSWTDLDARSD